MKTFVISDLHVAAGPRDDLSPPAEERLLEFLRNVSSVAPVRLVINGDFIDFAQIPPATRREAEHFGIDIIARGQLTKSDRETVLCHDQATSQSKLRLAIQEHPRTFAAIRGIAGFHPENQVIIMPGNHDADLYFPDVAAELATAVSSDPSDPGSRVRIHLERRLLLFDSGPTVAVEHGHQFDPANSFYEGSTERWSGRLPPIGQVQGESQFRLMACTGTRFLIEAFNQLDEDFPWLDNIQPLSRAWSVLGALVREDPHSVPIRLLIALLALTSGLSRMDIGALSSPQASGPLAKQILNRDPSLAILIERIETATDFEEMLKSVSDAIARSPVESVPRGTLGQLAQSASLDIDLILERSAANVRRETSVDSVVMGHTHVAVDNSKGGYVNTGSWSPVFTEQIAPSSIVARDSFVSAAFALISEDGVQLQRFS